MSNVYEVEVETSVDRECLVAEAEDYTAWLWAVFLLFKYGGKSEEQIEKFHQTEAGLIFVVKLQRWIGPGYSTEWVKSITQSLDFFAVA
jgi:hypothetical protein